MPSHTTAATGPSRATLPLLVTMGDAAGIGPEIVARAAAAGGASFFSLLICLIMMKMISARITKFSATVMKLPYANTAPAFLASASVVAVWPASGTK